MPNTTYLIVRLFVRVCFKMAPLWAEIFLEKRIYQRKKGKIFSFFDLWFIYITSRNVIFTTIGYPLTLLFD